MASSQVESFKESNKHSYHRRAFKHNYFAPFIYHIILKKEKKCERFGEVSGDAKIPYDNPGCAVIESSLGQIIAKAIIHLPYEFPILKLHQFKVMPDHVHIIMEVKDWSAFHLDFYIDRLKANITKKYSRLKEKNISDEDIFEVGYCDKPLLLGISLDGWYKYIRENPHRLAMRIQYPVFFQRNRKLKIGDREYDAFGNLFLFRNPDKIAVKMSNKYSDEMKMKKMEEYTKAYQTGSVLVSPFIHELEKKIRDMAESEGAKIILIKHEAFPERYKPALHDFNQCSEGKLMIISMGYPQKTPLTKRICNEMNELAKLICKSI